MATRPSLLSNNSSSRFPSYQARGSSSLASPTTQARTPVPQDSHSTPARKKGHPSLSLGKGSPTSGSAAESIHPLKYTWDVWFSQRTAGNKGGKKDDKANPSGHKEKESREDWEGGVVKLGGFSSIESLHPFLAHLVPPSALPASLHSSHTLFSPSSADAAPPQSNLICDYNLFRSSIAPAWEDQANVGGGRWVVRLRKGVADRVWEEAVYALVGERIGGDDERTGEKVNGLVLSVRKDEDILSLWVAPSSRADRDIIRDSLRAALQPLLTSTSSAALQLDYKPHPVTGGERDPLTPSGAPLGSSRLLSLARELSDSPVPRRRHHAHNGEEGGRSPRTPGAVVPGSGSGSARGFSGYISRTASEGGRERLLDLASSSSAFGERRSSPGHAREASPAGAVGSGAFGRPRLGQRGESQRGGEQQQRSVFASLAASGGDEDRAAPGGGAWGRF
ncbi:hypothetical protein JCM10207_008821 [Rhodosporidiobolus poonsookiae]